MQEEKDSKDPKIDRSHKKDDKKPEIAKNGEKSFKYYQSLPEEVRMMVVDEMKPIDRCRLSQCSLLISKEAKRSKNYMYSLEFYGVYEYGEEARIIVTFNNQSWNNGFGLHFQADSDKKYMECKNFQWKELWRIELPGSTDLVQYAAELFKTMLQDYQNIIKELIFLIQLSAPFVKINIGKLTENDIYKVIKSWKNQPTEGEEIRYEWLLRGSNFDVSKLLRLLNTERSYDPEVEEEELKIKHGFEKGKEALLLHSDKVLVLKAGSN